MMTSLVTGCAGFIGSHLTQRLLSEGHHVIGVDSLTDYYSPDIKRQNLALLAGDPHFEFLASDAGMISRDIVSRVAYVFHLAAQPGVRASWGPEFDIYVERNITTTRRLLDLALDSQGLQKFVYASSSSVYGNIAVEKVAETYPTQPYSPYGVTKLAAEHLCRLYGENFGLPVISTRFFTVYGPRQRPDMAFSRLVTSALKGGEFTLFGDGTQERDFTYVADIVAGLLAAATSAQKQGTYNLGGGRVVSMLDILRTLESITGERLRIVQKPPQKGDVFRTGADITKARAEIGYCPQYSIEQGLREQVEYVRRTTLS